MVFGIEFIEVCEKLLESGGILSSRFNNLTKPPLSPLNLFENPRHKIKYNFLKNLIKQCQFQASAGSICSAVLSTAMTIEQH